MSRVAVVFPNLREISGELEICPNDLRALGRLNGSDLSVVDLRECNLSALGIQGLCRGSPNLKRLCLRNVAPDYNFVDATVHFIVTNCPKIEALSLDFWLELTDVSMVYLSQLQYLRELNLTECHKLTSAAVQDFLRANQRLEVLILCDDSDLDVNSAPEYIDSALLTCIGLNCPKLTKLLLDLPNTSDVTDASLTNIARGCPLLEELRFAEFKKPNTLLPTLGACCPLLKRLYLRSVLFSDDDLLALCKGCPGLLSLRLPECHCLSNTAVGTIAFHCKKLQGLLLTESSTVTDQSMSTLFSSCTGLRSVHLGRLVPLTSASILTLLQNCPLLQSLGLDWEYSQTYDTVAACTDVSQAVELARSQAITDETLAQIPICCKELKILRLYHCHFISNAAVWSLINSCKGLTEFTVHSCQHAKPSPECLAKYQAIGEQYRGLKVSWG